MQEDLLPSVSCAELVKKMHHSTNGLVFCEMKMATFPKLGLYANGVQYEKHSAHNTKLTKDI